MRASLVLAVFCALGLFSGASAAQQTLTVPISVICVNPTGELCSPPATIPVSTTGVLQASYTAPISHCGPIIIHFLVDGVERAVTPILAAGQSSTTYDLGPVSAGSHILGIQGEGAIGGCNSGIELGFGGTVQVTLSPLSVPAPGILMTGIALLIAAFAFFRYRRA
jgi:hypothetical protein